MGLHKAPEFGEFHLVSVTDKATGTVTITGKKVIPLSKKEGAKNTPLVKDQPLEASNIIVNLNDSLVDLDKPITILYNGKEAFKGVASRNYLTIAQNIVERVDIHYAFPVRINLK